MKQVKVIGPGRSADRSRKKSWQWAKHAWPSSDLPQALKGEYVSALGPEQKER